MSIKYLGEQFDIHGGGIDHIPIHHTNEIAQSEAATGKHPWVRYWLHNEFLVLDKGKMSKSSGDFLTLQSLVDDGYHPLDYRYFLLGGHYRSQLQFSLAALDGARNARKSLGDRIRLLAEKAGGALPVPGEALPAHVTGGRAGVFLEAFDKALKDDLSSPRALAELWRLLKDTEIAPADALAAAFDMDGVLGLDLIEAAAPDLEKTDENMVKEIDTLIKERIAAKKAKDFAKADKIRNSLKERGIMLEDGPSGTVWRRV
jgi:cysteinyl-tRNA synthetase